MKTYSGRFDNKHDLLAAFKEAIWNKGFFHAWETFLEDMLHLHHTVGSKDSVNSDDLEELLRLSPVIHQLLEKEEKKAEEKESTVTRFDSMFHSEYKDAIHKLYKEHATDFDGIHEPSGQPVKVLHNKVFTNWGRTVANIPEYTFFPKSKLAVQQIVLWAKENGKRVRVAGYRHTWGDMYSADGQVLISTLSLDVATELPAKHPPMDPTNDLEGIEMVGTIVEDCVTKGLCKIGAATTNEQFRVWATNNDTGLPKNWTIPLNVIMVEITWGGSNGPICHGAGLEHKTLSDLVYEIEYVDVNGKLQTVNDPELLKAASGAFGLLGVVTSVTLKLDKMTFANMRPFKQRVGLAIPPPTGYTVPEGVDMSGITAEDEAQAFQDFVERVENDYYSEFFWFTLQKNAWVNCWKNDGAAADSKPYPSAVQTVIQEAEEYISQLLTECWLFRLLPLNVQSKLMTTGAMIFLPNIQDGDPSIVTPLIDGLHFRRGIQNMRVYDMEWEIPIPAKADDPNSPDWSICQKAWWAVISAVYNRYNADSHDVPMQLTLEMRIMGDSDVTMAPQYGNKFGTCSIEVLTILTTPKDTWQDFLQEVTDAWTALKGPNGETLNARPHWAKQWQNLTVNDMDIVDYLKNVAYKDRLPEFKAGLQAIATEQGFTLQDLQDRFSNPLFDQLFESVFV